MAFKIAPHKPIPLVPKYRPIERPVYKKFIGMLPCVVTKQTGKWVDPAHVSTKSELHGHLGRGKGQKASDRWMLPLHRKEHTKQHSMNEMEYWKQVGIDPHLTCLVFFGLWNDYGSDAVPLAEEYINRL